jgi:hypothetical protein
MNNAVVQSVTARCLLDPSFLRMMSSDPASALKTYGLDEDEWAEFSWLDLKKVRSLAGFIVRVQHNFLWESLPYTLALLSFYRAEISVFEDYFGHYRETRARSRASRRQKIKRFLSWMKEYLKSTGSSFPGLYDVLTHERIVWEIGIKTAEIGLPVRRPSRSASSSLKVSQLERLVPEVRGVLRIGEFRYSPLKIIDQLNHNKVNPRPLGNKRLHLCYWANPDSLELRMFEVDRVTAALLRAVDGQRSIGSILDDCLGQVTARSSRPPYRMCILGAEERGILRLRAGTREG